VEVLTGPGAVASAITRKKSKHETCPEVVEGSEIRNCFKMTKIDKLPNRRLRSPCLGFFSIEDLFVAEFVSDFDIRISIC
jgi:hypothetical protein